MTFVWVITLVDYGQAEIASVVEAVCASRPAVDRYIAGYISRQPDADWRTNRRGFKGNWANDIGLAFEVHQMTVWS